MSNRWSQSTGLLVCMVDKPALRQLEQQNILEVKTLVTLYFAQHASPREPRGQARLYHTKSLA